MDNERLTYLINSYRRDNLTTPEREELMAFIDADTAGSRTIPILQFLLEAQGEGTKEIDRARWQPLLDQILSVDKGPAQTEGPFIHPKVGFLPWRRIAAAAAILVLATSTWFWLHYGARSPQPPVAATHDIPAPTGNRATILLGSGQKIILDSAATGQIATQGLTQITKGQDGSLAYTPGRTPTTGAAPIIYNTLYNPRGSKPINITMSDGTRAWLNTESSLRYPVAFTGKERGVEITGEAYFEVAPNASQPFIVKTSGSSTEVLGTRFNINAYPDEAATSITLLQGRIRVQKENSSVILRPGEQARIVSTRLETLKNIDLESVMAWKNGLFAFTNADLPAVMRQLGRWYDVNVEYQGIPEKRVFSGEIGKNLSLSQVLGGLARTRVHYEIVGAHKIIIRP